MDNVCLKGKWLSIWLSDWLSGNGLSEGALEWMAGRMEWMAMKMTPKSPMNERISDGVLSYKIDWHLPLLHYYPPLPTPVKWSSLFQLPPQLRTFYSHPTQESINGLPDLVQCSLLGLSLMKELSPSFNRSPLRSKHITTPESEPINGLGGSGIGSEQ